MIIRRHKPDTESPTEKIARLEAAIAALTDKLDRHIKHAEAMDRLADRSYDQLESTVCDTVERIKNMELRVFPNLAHDMLRLFEILPHDDTGWNPLDYRDR